jgi:hypothetical protein
MLQPVKCLKTYQWLFVERFWSNTGIEQQKQEHGMNVEPGWLDHTLITHRIQTGWELPIAQYPN